MAYSAKILLDSVAPNGHRLTTFEVTYPRFVHCELMTHRQFSRNSSSSRAIPIAKMIDAVLEDPVFPVWWGKAQSGMQAHEEIDEDAQNSARRRWLLARNKAIMSVQEMMELGLHKQIPNRLLEPWMWITVIVTASEYENFFSLRCHPDAQPEIRRIAEMMRDLYYSQEPTPVSAGFWHLPLTGFSGDEALDADALRKVSVARCARVSYLTHEGKRDVGADLALYDRLVSSGHMSPSEHQGCAMGAQWWTESPMLCGNFKGWIQHRKLLPGECRSYRPSEATA